MGKFLIIWLVLYSICICEEAQSVNYYRILDVPTTASKEQIKSSYRRLALANHPDKNKNNEEAQQRFVLISKAYEVLSDPDRRLFYDRHGIDRNDAESDGNRSGRNSVHKTEDFYEANSNVISLTPRTIQQTVFNSPKHMWLVEFYSPACGPCQRFAPEFSKFAASIDSERYKVGAVNCRTHGNLCRQFNVRSYPSVFLFQQGAQYGRSVPEQYSGEMTAFALQEYLSALGSPKYVEVTLKTYATTLAQLRKTTSVLVHFGMPGCAPCVQLKQQLRIYAGEMLDRLVVLIVDCRADSLLCQQNNIQSYPNLHFWLHGAQQETAEVLYPIDSGGGRRGGSDSATVLALLRKFLSLHATVLPALSSGAGAREDL